VRAAVKALESIGADWTLLDLLPAEDRERLQKAVAAIHNPDRVMRRRRATDGGGSTRGARAARDRDPDAAQEAGLHDAERFSAGEEIGA
jgi:hypothetical protein